MIENIFPNPIYRKALPTADEYPEPYSGPDEPISNSDDEVPF